MSLEIERKFMLAEIPRQLIEEGQLLIKSEQYIEQTYLAIDKTQEVRVRTITDLQSGSKTYTHTFKLGNGLLREEIEYEITESIYTQLTAAFDYTPLTKKRTTAEWKGITVEIDSYDQLQLIVVEVEFTSEEEALAFVPPAWFGEDISSQRQYSNKKVWKELQLKQ